MAQQDRARVLFTWAALLAISILTFSAFAPILANQFVNWGDRAELIANDHYKGFSSANLEWMLTAIHMGHWQPLTWLTFAVDYSIWGLNPVAYHVHSVVLHIACAIAAFFLIRDLWRAAEERSPSSTGSESALTVLAAVIGALMFAVHPLRVETVAWAVERRGVLSALFYLLSVWCYLRFAMTPRQCGERIDLVAQGAATHRHGGSSSRTKPGRRNPVAARPRILLTYFLSFLFFALSLLAKEFSISLPVVLLILDIYPLRRWNPTTDGWFGHRIWMLVREKLPLIFVAAVGTFIAIAASAQSGVAKSLSDYGPLQRLAQASWGLVFYPVRSVVPIDLSPLYPIPLHLNPFDSQFIACAIVVVIAAIAIFLNRRRWPALGACAACYVVIVAPVLGLTQTGRQMAADRYSYLPAVGVSALIGWLLLRLWRGSALTAWKLGAGAIAAAMIAVLILLTQSQVRVWHDSIALWSHARGLYPNDAAIANNLGEALGEAQRLDEAAELFQIAMRLNSNFTDARNNYGTILAMQGHFAQAIEQWNASLEINPDQPAVRKDIQQAQQITHQQLAR